MSKWVFEEPVANSGAAIEVYVTDPDVVLVFLARADQPDESVCVTFWQLARIVDRIRAEYATQLDREASEQRATGNAR